MSSNIKLKDPDAVENVYYGVNTLRVPDNDSESNGTLDFINPSGSIELNQNGTFNVRNYDTVIVNFLGWSIGGRY